MIATSRTGAGTAPARGPRPGITSTTAPAPRPTSATSRTTRVPSVWATTAMPPVRGGSSRSTPRFPSVQGRHSSSGCGPSLRPRVRAARWSTGTSPSSRPARTAPIVTCARSGACCTTSTLTSCVNGHDHLYERFGPQDPDGRLDPARGIRQITVGTGGGALYTPITSAANTEAIGIVYGVIKLTLSSRRLPVAVHSDSRDIVLGFGHGAVPLTLGSRGAGFGVQGFSVQGSGAGRSVGVTSRRMGLPTAPPMRL